MSPAEVAQIQWRGDFGGVRLLAVFRSTAHVYDLVHELSGKDYAAESASLVQQIRCRVPGARTLLDVACGTGGHLVHLSDDFEVVGVDLDENMLAEARKRLPGIELVEADMRSFDLDRDFDAVVCLFSSLATSGTVMRFARRSAA